MTREEAALILMELGTNYPDTDKGKSREAMTMKVDLWTAAFANVPYEVVQAAIRAYMVNSINRFAPNIGQIVDTIRSLTHPNELSEGEAWALVQKAMRNATYNAAEEFSKLPPLLQKVVGSASNLRDWGSADSDTAVSVIASNFQRGYRTVQAREAAMEKTPLEIRQRFAALTAPMPEALEAKSKGPRLLIGDESTPWPPDLALESPPAIDIATNSVIDAGQAMTGEALRQKIAELRIAAGEVVITEESKQAALERVRQYGKEQA
jgi:hypothetical protein